LFPPARIGQPISICGKRGRRHSDAGRPTNRFAHRLSVRTERLRPEIGTATTIRDIREGAAVEEELRAADKCLAVGNRDSGRLAESMHP